MPLLDWDDPATWAQQYELSWRHNKRIRLNYHRAVMMNTMRQRAPGLVDALPLVDGETILIVGAGYGWLQESLEALLPASSIVSIDNGALVQGAKDQTDTADIRAAITAAGLDPDAGDGALALALIDDGGAKARVSVLNEGLENNGSRNRVRTALGGSPATWAISEHVLQSYDDPTIARILADMDGTAANIAHLVTPRLIVHGGFTLQAMAPGDIGTGWKVTKPSGRDHIVHHPGDRWLTELEWRALLDANGAAVHKLVRTGSFKVF